jgi:glycosyltransferase involved in cell wall biosynthesis
VRVLVCPARMEIGGSQSNAVELARGVADLGHEVTLFGPDGPLVAVVADLGLDYVVAPVEQSWPSRRNIAALRSHLRARPVDVLHGYEWGPTVDLAFGPHLTAGIPLLTTVLSMSVPDFLPRHCPLIVGTAQLAEQHAGDFTRVSLMEPPIDTVRNAPRDTVAARRRFGIRPDEMVLTVVGRLVPDLEKVQGVLAAIGAVDALAGARPVRLLVVGDGPGLPDVRARAVSVNARHQRDVVTVTGSLLDPRDAYEAADIVLGMGSSALKGLAFGKPLVVQGAAGFWRLAEPATSAAFLREGWYGRNGAGVPDLLAALGPVLDDAARRRYLGSFGRELVVDRFSLTAASGNLEAAYSAAVAEPPSRAATARGLTASGFRLARFKFAMARHRLAAGRPALAATSGTSATSARRARA